MARRSFSDVTRMRPSDFNLGDLNSWRQFVGSDKFEGAMSRRPRHRRPLGPGRIIDFVEPSISLSERLERKALRANMAFKAFARGVGDVWDEIMRRTAYVTPPAQKSTYGVDIRAGGQMVKFRVWWDNFKGRPEAAAQRFMIRRAILEDWWAKASRELNGIVR